MCVRGFAPACRCCLLSFQSLCPTDLIWNPHTQILMSSCTWELSAENAWRPICLLPHESFSHKTRFLGWRGTQGPQEPNSVLFSGPNLSLCIWFKRQFIYQTQVGARCNAKQPILMFECYVSGTFGTRENSSDQRLSLSLLLERSHVTMVSWSSGRLKDNRFCVLLFLPSNSHKSWTTQFIEFSECF